MKKLSVSVFAVVLLGVTPALAQDYCASSNCEWGDSLSAADFVDALTDPVDGILHENWPVYSWTVEILDQNKFDDLMDNVVYFKYFMANRVLEVCEANRESWGETDMSTCDSARAYIRNSWMYVYTGSTMDEQITDSFNDVDPDNWFSYDSFNDLSADYVQAGDMRVYMVRDFWHAERLVEGGGVEMDDLPIVADLDELTITIFSSELFD